MQHEEEVSTVLVKTRLAAVFTAMVLFAGLVAGCEPYDPDDGILRGFIDITGSNTVTPVSSIIAEEFMAIHNQVNIAVSGPGSGAGIANLINGTTDICQSSRPIRQVEISWAAERGIEVVETRIATDVLAVIVNPANTVSSLTVEQVSGVYTGAITNWSQLGGNDAPIIALARDTNSGTHVYFKETVVQMAGLVTHDSSLEYGGRIQFLPSTSMGVTQVAQNPNAVFFIGLGYMNVDVKPLAIAMTTADTPVVPSLETALDGSYSIARGLYYYTNGHPEGLMKEFISFVLSTRGQELVTDAGFAPVTS